MLPVSPSLEFLKLIFLQSADRTSKKIDLSSALSLAKSGLVGFIHVYLAARPVWWPRGSCPRLQAEWSSFKHCVVFLGKTLYSHSSSLRPGVLMGTGKFNAGGNPAMDQHPFHGVVEILLVALCYRSLTETRPSLILPHLAHMQT